MDMEIKLYQGFSEELVKTIHSLEVGIFEHPYTIDKLRREGSVKPNLISLVAINNGMAVGYKVGYEMTSRLFYSWMGGVHPECRGKGIARKLMAEQHSIVTGQGYKVVRTYTENKYRDMLLLNIRAGFDVVGVMNDPTKPKIVIILDKQLECA